MRGSPYLRKTLFVITTILLTNAPADEPVFQPLDRKHSEVEPYCVYMTAGANKFLRRYYDEVMESPLVCHVAQLACPVKDTSDAVQPFILD